MMASKSAKNLVFGFNGFVLFCFSLFCPWRTKKAKPTSPVSKHLLPKTFDLFRFRFPFFSQLCFVRTLFVSVFFSFVPEKMFSEPIILSYNRLPSFKEEFLNVREPYFLFWVSHFISLHLRVTNSYLLLCFNRSTASVHELGTSCSVGWHSRKIWYRTT